MTSMQFGLFTVGDVTPDPVNNTIQTEHERIKNTITIKGDPRASGHTVYPKAMRPRSPC